jgi:hypothetical protein
MRVPGADSRGHEIELVISALLGAEVDSRSELSRLLITHFIGGSTNTMLGASSSIDQVKPIGLASTGF